MGRYHMGNESPLERVASSQVVLGYPFGCVVLSLSYPEGETVISKNESCSLLTCTTNSFYLDLNSPNLP